MLDNVLHGTQQQLLSEMDDGLCRFVRWDIYCERTALQVFALFLHYINMNFYITKALG